MKLRCLLGRHDAVADFTDWRHGYFQSRCAHCGTEMRYYGTHWERASKTRRRHSD